MTEKIEGLSSRESRGDNNMIDIYSRLAAGESIVDWDEVAERMRIDRPVPSSDSGTLDPQSNSSDL
jgi:hypothetical protein